MSVELFKQGKLKALNLECDGRKSLKITDIWLTCYVSTGDAIVAFADVKRRDGKTNFLAKCIETQGHNWCDKAIQNNGRNWHSELLWKGGERYHIVFASVAKGDTIYILFACKDTSMSLRSETGFNNKRWDFEVNVCRIMDEPDAQGERIDWDCKELPESLMTQDDQKKLLTAILRYGFAFLLEDGTVVFILSGQYFHGENYILMIAHSKDPSSDLTFYVSEPGDYKGVFFLWGNQLFFVPHQCSADRKLRVSNDIGRTWEETAGPLAEKLYALDGDRFAFTPITIEGRRVLLFAVVPYTDDSSKEDDIDVYEDLSGNHYINLFMADDEHFDKVGRLFVIIKEESAGGFLYTNDELFFSYHGKSERKYSDTFICLKEHLGKIKLLLEEWYSEDEEHATGRAEPVAEVSENLTKLAVTKTSRKRRR